MSKNIHGIIVWFVATLFVVYSFCLNTAAAVFMETIKTSFHATNFSVSLAMGAFVLGFACMQIPAGYLLDTYKTKSVVSTGVFLLALGNILITFADNLFFFACANLLQGIGASFAFTAIGVLISQWFKAAIFPILFGLTQTISCVLSAFIHYLFMMQLGVHSWQNIYEILAMIGAGIFVLTLIIVQSPRDYQKRIAVSLSHSLSTVLKNKQIILCTFAAALSFGILLAYASLWYLPIQHFYSVKNIDSVIISGMIFVGIGIGTPFLGWLSNVTQSRTMILHVSLALGTIALLLGIYLPHYAIHTLIIIKIVSFLIGFLLSGSMLYYTVVSEISTDGTRGVALSVTNTGVFLVNTIMMFVPYFFITTLSKTFFTYLWILPCCVLCALLLNYFVKETYSSPPLPLS